MAIRLILFFVNEKCNFADAVNLIVFSTAVFSIILQIQPFVNIYFNYSYSRAEYELMYFSEIVSLKIEARSSLDEKNIFFLRYSIRIPIVTYKGDN